MSDDDPKKGPPAPAASEGDSAPVEEPDEGPRARRVRPILESAVADMVRRGIEMGWERVSKGERGAALRAALGDLKVPREIASYVASQLDDTKNAILKVVATELREFLETSHFADELARLLTTLQFEITTTVRFTPSAEGKAPRPKVSSQTKLRRRTDRE